MFGEACATRNYDFIKPFKSSVNGYTGLITFTEEQMIQYSLKYDKVVFKISIDINESIEYEYNVLMELNTHIPHYVKALSLEYLYVDMSKADPFDTSDHQALTREAVLFLKYIPNMKTFSDMSTRLTTKSRELISLMVQCYISIYIGYKTIGLVHGDLHMENVTCVKCDKNLVMYYKINNETLIVPTYGNMLKIIDFGESRTTNSVIDKPIIWVTTHMYRGTIPPVDTGLLDLLLLTNGFTDEADYRSCINNNEMANIIRDILTITRDTTFKYEDLIHLRYKNHLLLGQDIVTPINYITQFFKMIDQNGIIKRIDRENDYKAQILDTDSDICQCLITSVILPTIDYTDEDLTYEEYAEEEPPVFESDGESDVESYEDSDDEYVQVSYQGELDSIYQCLKTLSLIEKVFGYQKALLITRSISKSIRLRADVITIFNEAFKSINSDYTYQKLQELLIDVSLIIFIEQYKVCANYIAGYMIDEMKFRVGWYNLVLKELDITYEQCIVTVLKALMPQMKYNYRNVSKVSVIDVDSSVYRKYDITYEHKMNSSGDLKEFIDQYLSVSIDNFVDQ